MKHDAIEIADLSGIQDACHVLTQIGFFVPRSWQDEKNFFLCQVRAFLCLFSQRKLDHISVFFPVKKMQRIQELKQAFDVSEMWQWDPFN